MFDYHVILTIYTKNVPFFLYYCIIYLARRKIFCTYVNISCTYTVLFNKQN